MAKIDKLGRVVIPVEYRRRLGIKLEDEIDISLSDTSVVIKPKALRCRICGTRIDKAEILPLCEKCIDLVTTLHR